MISRSIMLNPKIPVESKAIYSILAVFAGDKDRCFPTIKTLVEATGISKDRLYKYLNILCDSGIVERVHIREGGCYKNVVYMLKDGDGKIPFPENTEKENTVSGFYLQPFPDFKDSPFPENKESNNNIYNNNINNNIYCASVPDDTKKAPDKTKKEASELFEKVWALYPSKKGKGQVSDTQKKKLLKIGEEELTRAIERYKADLSRDEWRNPQNGSTFFNSGYVDYLDENWQAGADSSDTEDDAAAWERARAEMERLASIGPRVDGPF